MTVRRMKVGLLTFRVCRSRFRVRRGCACLLRAAVAGEDPVLLLLPKHLFRDTNVEAVDRPVRFGEGALRRQGGTRASSPGANCVRLALTAAERLRGTEFQRK